METDRQFDSPKARVLVVVAQAVQGDEFRDRMRSLSRGRRLELCLLAPAFVNSGLEYFTSDVDRGPADEIVLVPSPERDQWAEKELFERVCERFGLPVWEIVLN